MTSGNPSSERRTRQGWLPRLAGWLWPFSDQNLARRARRLHKAGELKAALRLWKRVAARGNAVAQYHVGMMYERGEAVLANALDAVHWYSLAGEQGHGPAQERLAVIYGDGAKQPPGMRERDPVIAALFPAGMKLERNRTLSLYWARLAAGQDMPMACTLLGNYYAYGSDEPDYHEAERWYRKAAGLGNAQGMLGLGTLLAGGYLGTSDYSQAREWLMKAAEQRLGIAWYYLGEIYRRGLGCEPSATAVACLAQGANLGNAAAQRQLGLCYLNGEYIDRNIGQAETWLRKAALQGDPESMMLLGRLHSTEFSDRAANHHEAASWYRQAAEIGHRDAQFQLGLLYLAGTGLPPEPELAFTWCLRAAEQGHVGAQMHVGACLAEGNGVERSPGEALKWFRVAADQGNADALYNLGYLYERGLDGPPDPGQAVTCFRQAAEAGSGIAQLHLSALYARGDGLVAQDYAEAFRLARMAAEQGLVGAMVNLGRFYMQGLGVERSDSEAEHWLTLAADHDVRALTALGELYAVYGDNRDMARAREYMSLAASRGEPRAADLLASPLFQTENRGG